ncbi:type II secretion system F family protein [Haematomicrobium sanguinis]|uniref:type II secretion system F family protein n=1 Tax=Haematomicrobium sanguinis TaxID=479106 RepID=UPI00047890B9|nr:type II secretion system F family protein [Haematomicrobium sanguinis]
MSTEAILAIAVGLVAGVGLVLIARYVPFARKRSFAERISTQLSSADTGSRLLNPGANPITPFGSLERIAGPIIRDGVSRLNRLLPVSATIKIRLNRAGASKSVNDFRAEQIMWSITGLAGAILLVIYLIGQGTGNLVVYILLIAALPTIAFLTRDYALTRQVARRERRMLEEFPALAEMIALAVGAGESATGAVERVCRSADGELVREFENVLVATRSGVPLLAALQNMSNRVQVTPLVRFVDGITVAVERGTPLADVIRAQAQDVRDLAKQELMESAGRKEIGMMVPLVFGVLPLTIIFAAFPGLTLLQIGLN